MAKTIDDVRKEVMAMPFSQVIEELVAFKMQNNTPKVIITPEQFDEFFRIRGLATSITDLIAGKQTNLFETRGRKPKTVEEDTDIAV